MVNKEKIIKTIFQAVDEVNEFSPKERRLQKTDQTDLMAGLDSLGLVTLIVAVEQKVEEQFGVTIVLADRMDVSAENNPFQTIGTLVNYVLILLEKTLNGQTI